MHGKNPTIFCITLTSVEWSLILLISATTWVSALVECGRYRSRFCKNTLISVRHLKTITPVVQAVPLSSIALNGSLLPTLGQ
jgi:hypothetical protein